MAPEFDNLIQSVKAGDPKAAETLVKHFEPEVRRIVRFRLRDPKMRRVLDSTDICQSVFGNFFFLAALGRFDLRKPQDLVNLLAKMATNRLIDRYRREQNQQRLHASRKESMKYSDAGEQIDHCELPDAAVESAELLHEVKIRLSESERQISELRNQGCSWLEVSKRLGESPQALRKRLERGCERVFDELGIGKDD